MLSIRSRASLVRAAWLALNLALGGCAVGPDFVRPPPPPDSDYGSAGAPPALTSQANEP